MQLDWQQHIGINSEHLLALADARGRQHQVNMNIAADLKALLEAAAADGLRIAIISSFRSFERQLAIWNRKWQGQQAVLDRHGLPIDITQLSDQEKFSAICHWSALPGFSRHHWGTDLDIFDAAAIDAGHVVKLVPQEFAANGPCAKLEKWLAQNLERFGFYRPYLEYRGGVAAEPWHISHQSESAKVLASFDYQACLDHLHQSQVAGMQTIDAHYNKYIAQYFTNLCEAVT